MNSNFIARCFAPVLDLGNVYRQKPELFERDMEPLHVLTDSGREQPPIVVHGSVERQVELSVHKMSRLVEQRLAGPAQWM